MRFIHFVIFVFVISFVFPVFAFNEAYLSDIDGFGGSGFFVVTPEMKEVNEKNLQELFPGQYISSSSQTDTQSEDVAVYDQGSLGYDNDNNLVGSENVSPSDPVNWYQMVY